MNRRTSEAKSPTKSARSPFRSKTASAAASKNSRTNGNNSDTSSVYTSDIVTEIDSDYLDSESIESTAREKLAEEEFAVEEKKLSLAADHNLCNPSNSYISILSTRAHIALPIVCPVLQGGEFLWKTCRTGKLLCILDADQIP